MRNALIENINLQILHFDSWNSRQVTQGHFQQRLVERKGVKVVIYHLSTDKILYKFNYVGYQVPLFPNRPIHDCFEQIRKIRRRIDVRLVQHLYSLNNFRSITTVNHHILRRVNLLAEYPVVPVHFEVLQNLQLVLRQMHRRFLILHLVERVFRYLQVGPKVHCGHLIHDSKEVDVCLI